MARHMDWSGPILALAIAILFAANVGFSEKAYFHPWYLVVLNVFGLISALAFFLAYAWKAKRSEIKPKINIYIIITIVAFFLLIVFQYVWIAALITIAALYSIAALHKKLARRKFWYAAVSIIIIASFLSYLSVSGLRGASWKGIDEVAYNYYAPYLLVHGTNPYSTSMFPIILEHNITPTYLLNGTVETAYDYPAFSFIPVMFLGFFDLHGFLVFIAILAFLITASAFMVYKSSGYNNLVLVPLASWILFSYFFMGTIDQYISVSILLLLAYLLRKRTIVSGALLGLAASTIQLAWFAIPFMLILIFRESGKRELLKYIAIALIAFLAVNGYFIIIGPMHFLRNIMGLFGSSKLLLVGTDIMQIFVTSYGVPLWYPEAISITALLACIILFYFYTRTLRPFVAIVPAFIFMLTWHNFLMYSLAYVPLAIAVVYENIDPKTRKDNANDIIRNRIYIVIAFAALAIIFAILAIVLHGIYVSSNTISINAIAPYIIHSQEGNSYSINGITLNVSNNADHYENISFFIINRNPLKDGVFLSSNLSGIDAHSYKEYVLNYNVTGIRGNSTIYIMAFSTDYIRSAKLGISPGYNASAKT